MAEPLVCWLEACGKDSVSLVGGKNASLGELIHAGVRVPLGFAITTAGYRMFCTANGLDERIRAVLADVDVDDMADLEARSRAVREMVEESELPLELEDLVAEHYRLLSMRCCIPAIPVAVRSSATAEDLPDASFAGQQDTFLWIRGIDEVLLHIRRCFSSLFTARAIAYRRQKGFDDHAVAISVGVQKMANASSAGVMFTLNPANGDRSVVVINANFGFGESVVSGEVTPDEFVVDKVSLDVIKRRISTKEVYCTVDPVTQTAKMEPLPAERQTVQSLLDDDLRELAEMGKRIERHYGRPMDVEWAVDKNLPTGGNVFILQARPETVWAGKKKQGAKEAAAGSAMDLIVADLLGGRKTNLGG